MMDSRVCARYLQTAAADPLRALWPEADSRMERESEV